MMLRTIFIMTLLLASMPSVATWETPIGAAQEITIAQQPITNAVTNATRQPYFIITSDDVSEAVAEQLRLQGIEEKSDVTLAIGSPRILASADHKLTLIIHALQIDPDARRWQAQANIVAGGITETVKPVSGTYVGLLDVPVVTRQIGRNDIIEAADLSTKAIPKPQLRKETVTRAEQLLGKSPRAVISTNRPIRLSEISAPLVIKKGDAVQMTYTNPYMSIRATGTALEDGAMGERIRVKNDKSEKAISGLVAGSGHIEVNPSSSL